APDACRWRRDPAARGALRAGTAAGRGAAHLLHRVESLTADAGAYHWSRGFRAAGSCRGARRAHGAALLDPLLRLARAVGRTAGRPGYPCRLPDGAAIVDEQHLCRRRLFALDRALARWPVRGLAAAHGSRGRRIGLGAVLRGADPVAA